VISTGVDAESHDDGCRVRRVSQSWTCELLKVDWEAVEPASNKGICVAVGEVERAEVFVLEQQGGNAEEKEDVEDIMENVMEKRWEDSRMKGGRELWEDEAWRLDTYTRVLVFQAAG